jgi:hypothetical protein
MILMLRQKFCSIAGTAKGRAEDCGELTSASARYPGGVSGFTAVRQRHSSFAAVDLYKLAIDPRQQHLAGVDADKGLSPQPARGQYLGRTQGCACSHQHSHFLQCGCYCSTMCNTAPNLGYNFDNGLDLVRHSLISEDKVDISLMRNPNPKIRILIQGKTR